MYRKCLLAACVLGASVQAAAQFKMEREAGALDLTFASKPTRSMAQGLVQPATRPGMLRGVDVRHPAGW